ncbi:unnamed protein product, partial [marine sediment metagenome]
LLTVQWAVNLIVLVVLVFVFTPAGDWLGEKLIDVDPLEKVDYIVVLGGNNERAVEAANLYRHGWAKKVIFSSHEGGADMLRDVALAYGLPAEAVIMDRLPTTTACHPRTVARLPGIRKDTDRFIILTSSYHTARARACFVKGSYKNIIVRSPNWRRGGEFAPVGKSWRGRMHDLPRQFYEVLALCYYKLRGRI